MASVRFRFRLLPSSVVSLILALVSNADLPYAPSTLLQASHNGAQIVYILDPPSSSAPLGNLRALNTSSSFSIQNLPSITLSSTAPFLQNSPSAAYTASVDQNGNIFVVAGSCSVGIGSLWQFIPDPKSATGNGTWTQHSINTSNIGGSPTTTGVNFLASSIAFSATSQSNATIYSFGGMCPLANSSGGDWTSTATYSQQVTIFEPDSRSKYDFELGTSKGQPIAEAGFSITPLQPTFSNHTSGSQSRQQNFLLLGGHIQNAFINMSQVALFSLPETSWSFLPIISDVQSSPPSVEPRSGHTALLSSDGSRIVVFGGWVGDLTSPAEPQLAILNVGTGYGGSGSWSWSSSPAPQPSGLEGEGIYGHGAVMLPGDVMMVSGGYSIASSGSTRIKRAAQASNVQSLFFNVTSNKWIDSYDPPPIQNTQSSQDISSGLLRTQPQKVGFGVGLTLGLLAIGLAALIGWIIARRYRRERVLKEQELREKEIEELDAIAQPYQGEGTGIRAWQAGARPNDGRQGIWKDSGVRDAERTGMDLDVPSPHRGLRRSMQARSRFDERRWSRGSGNIHPIEEGDEEDEIRPVSADDPFKDPEPLTSDANAKTVRRVPTILSRENAPSPAEQRDQEMQGWVHEWARKNSLPSSGRHSPDKSDRTISDLSETSALSHLSNQLDQVGDGARHAPINNRSNSLLRLISPFHNPFTGSSSVPGSPTHDSNPSPTRHPPRSAGADSFQTAHSHLADRQAESETLLGHVQPLSEYRSWYDPEADADAEPVFTRRTGPLRAVPTTKVGSWVGSVRRAINTASRSASMTSTSARVAGALGGFVSHEPSSTASSPTKERTRGLGMRVGMDDAEYNPDIGPSSQPVRRSASDGANLLWSSAKRGTQNWGVEADERRTNSLAASQRPGWRGARGEARPQWNGAKESNGGAGSDCPTEHPDPIARAGQREERLHDTADSDDWDVEAAARERSVQVMFTVPRERLRVVNADPEGASLRSVDTGGTGRGRGE